MARSAYLTADAAKRFVEFVRDSYRGDPGKTLSRLAHDMGVSESTASRILREDTGPKRIKLCHATKFAKAVGRHISNICNPSTASSTRVAELNLAWREAKTPLDLRSLAGRVQLYIQGLVSDTRGGVYSRGECHVDQIGIPKYAGVKAILSWGVELDGVVIFDAAFPDHLQFKYTTPDQAGLTHSGEFTAEALNRYLYLIRSIEQPKSNAKRRSNGGNRKVHEESGDGTGDTSDVPGPRVGPGVSRPHHPARA